MVVQTLQKDLWQEPKGVPIRRPQAARVRPWKTSVVMEAYIRRARAKLGGKTAGPKGTALTPPSSSERERPEGTQMRMAT